jgi:hypothetical protein
MNYTNKYFVRQILIAMGVLMVASAQANAFGDLLEGDFAAEAARQIGQVVGGGSETSANGIIESLNKLKAKKGKGFRLVLLDNENKQRVDQYAPGCDLEVKAVGTSKGLKQANITLIGTGSAEGYFPNEVVAAVLDPAMISGSKLYSQAYLATLSKKSKGYRYFDVVEVDPNAGTVIITKRFAKVGNPGVKETYAMASCVFTDEL